MRKKLLILLFIAMMLVPVSYLAADWCEHQLQLCLEEADDPEPCYVMYKECKRNQYGL